MQILHNSLHCSQFVPQCVSGSAWKAVVIQVTFDLLIFYLEHRISIRGFHANLHHWLRGFQRLESPMEPGFHKDTLRPPHIKYIIHHIGTTLPSELNAHSVWEMQPTPSSHLSPPALHRGRPWWLRFKALVIIQKVIPIFALKRTHSPVCWNYFLCHRLGFVNCSCQVDALEACVS